MKAVEDVLDLRGLLLGTIQAFAEWIHELSRVFLRRVAPVGVHAAMMVQDAHRDTRGEERHQPDKNPDHLGVHRGLGSRKVFDRLARYDRMTVTVHDPLAPQSS